ncbi:MAG: transcription termination/antitermination protein NusA, partial [bacterium]|nr:transcription termination/antitermination protein NusA [bacterium]
VRYSEDPVEYIVNALSPARIISVDILADDDTRKEAFVIVPDDQLSLAIGREGQNVRLAHRLTGWKIDIKSESQAAQMERQAKAAEVEEESAEAEETAVEETAEQNSGEQIQETQETVEAVEE